ncbi:SagB/ThcOx family dehydrogenase [Streptomyces sp. NPDC096153]|uniref:SagB/ThcOx family dehydrogenase n=1 Tax=Streptomyces sp. NPDC096153 TaxID=3155548 RepID=UPI00332A8085
MWDDYLGHRQHALADGVERLIRWFADWRAIESVRELATSGDGDDLLQLAHALCRRDILIAHGSTRHQREKIFEAEWSKWGHLTQAFHLATRSHADTPYIPLAADLKQLTVKQAVNPAPPPFTSKGSSGQIKLPTAETVEWDSRDLLEVLYRRRSRRQFGDSALNLQKLGALLHVSGAPKPHQNGQLTDAGHNVFKTSPSGGARHPTELYVYVRKVEGLQPGIYHYAADQHALEPLGRRWTDAELLSACGDQEWVEKSSALIFYTAIIARSQWKYQMGRVYRAVMMDVGHLSQTVYLLATALGIRITFTGALRDEMVEELVGCDPAQEIVIATSVLGTHPHAASP